jgi:phosphoglycolate phosphatase
VTPLVLFDLDGTLIDSSAGIFASMAHAFTRMGQPVPPVEQLRGYIGPPLRQSFPDVVGHDPEHIEQTVGHYRERYDSLGWSEHQVYPGITELVTTLAESGRRLAVVTTKLHTQAQKIVQHLSFGARIERVYGPNGDGSHSEKAVMIADALRDFGIPAAHTTMVGDRYFDIAGGIANGVRTLGVSWGFGSEEELRQAGAHAIAHTPAELQAMLLV